MGSKPFVIFCDLFLQYFFLDLEEIVLFVPVQKKSDGHPPTFSGKKYENMSDFPTLM